MSDQAGSPPPNKPTLTKKRFLVRFKNGGEAGPMPAAELQSLAESGRLGREDLVALEGRDQWASAASVKGLIAVPATPVNAATNTRMPVETSSHAPSRSQRGWIMAPPVRIAGLAVGGLLLVLELAMLARLPFAYLEEPPSGRGTIVVLGALAIALTAGTVFVLVKVLRARPERLETDTDRGSGEPTTQVDGVTPSAARPVTKPEGDELVRSKKGATLAVRAAVVILLALGLWFGSGLLVPDFGSERGFPTGDEVTLVQSTRLFPTLDYAERYVRGDVRVRAEIAEQDSTGIHLWPKLRRGDKVTVELGTDEDAEVIWVWMLRSGEVVKGFVPRNAVE